MLDELGDVVEVPGEGGAGELRLGHHGVDGHVAERVFSKERDGGVEDLMTGFLFAIDPKMLKVVSQITLPEMREDRRAESCVAQNAIIEGSGEGSELGNVSLMWSEGGEITGTPAHFGSTPLQTPTASLLIYLFADRVVPVTRRRRFPVPNVYVYGPPVGSGPGLRVPTVQLAAELLSVALWSLREQGAVALTVKTGLGIRGKRSRATVELLDGRSGVGLEGSLMNHLLAAEPGPSFIPQLGADFHRCFLECAGEGVDAGLLRPTGTKMRRRWSVADPVRVAR